MQFYCVNDHGFRRVIGFNDVERCVVSFYPHSPHFDWDYAQATKEESQKYLKDYGVPCSLNIPCIAGYLEWKQAVEDEMTFLELMREPEDESSQIQVSELVMQIFFLSGLSVQEVSRSLWE
jgi:hypothetical protein